MGMKKSVVAMTPAVVEAVHPHRRWSRCDQQVANGSFSFATLKFLQQGGRYFAAAATTVRQLG